MGRGVASPGSEFKQCILRLPNPVRRSTVTQFF